MASCTRGERDTSQGDIQAGSPAEDPPGSLSRRRRRGRPSTSASWCSPPCRRSWRRGGTCRRGTGSPHRPWWRGSDLPWWDCSTCRWGWYRLQAGGGEYLQCWCHPQSSLRTLTGLSVHWLDCLYTDWTVCTTTSWPAQNLVTTSRKWSRWNINIKGLKFPYFDCFIFPRGLFIFLPWDIQGLPLLQLSRQTKHFVFVFIILVASHYLKINQSLCSSTCYLILVTFLWWNIICLEGRKLSIFFIHFTSFIKTIPTFSVHNSGHSERYN